MNTPFVPAVIRPSWEGKYSKGAPVRYERRGLLRSLTPIYTVRLCTDFPLMLHASDGRTYSPKRLVENYDGATVPAIFQMLTWAIPGVHLQRDMYPRSTILHDSACQDHGLYVWDEGGCEFEQLSRAKVDWLYLDGLLAEGANTATRIAAYAGVRAYARPFVRW